MVVVMVAATTAVVTAVVITKVVITEDMLAVIEDPMAADMDMVIPATEADTDTVDTEEDMVDTHIVAIIKSKCDDTFQHWPLV